MENQNNQVIQPGLAEEPVIISNPPASPKSNMPLILGVLILVIIVAFGAYYLGTKNNNNQAESLTSTNASISPTPALSAKPSGTQLPKTTGSPAATAGVSGLKEYNNTTHGFTISYPKTWTQKNPSSSVDSTLVYLNADEKFGDESEPVVYSVWIAAESELPNVKFAKEQNGDYTIYQTQDLPSRSGLITSFITADDKKYITISITPYDTVKPFPSQDKYIEIYNQIILSFKLIN
jgi:hypothetical protein